MAILAAYMKNNNGASLADYLSNNVFAGAECMTVEPDAADEAGFAAFMERYKAGFAVERAAVDTIR
jgi:hypothetical protein